MMISPSRFATADAKLIEEVISQSEKRMQAQLDLAKAADQRALTFAGLLFAGVAVLIALISAERTDNAIKPGLIGVAFGFVVAAALAAWSARPVPWHAVGNEPASYEEDISAGKTFEQTRPETAMNYQKLIRHNEKVLAGNLRFMWASLMVALLTSLAGVFSIIL